MNTATFYLYTSVQKQQPRSFFHFGGTCGREPLLAWLENLHPNAHARTFSRLTRLYPRGRRYIRMYGALSLSIIVPYLPYLGLCPPSRHINEMLLLASFTTLSTMELFWMEHLLIGLYSTAQSIVCVLLLSRHCGGWPKVTKPQNLIRTFDKVPMHLSRRKFPVPLVPVSQQSCPRF